MESNSIPFISSIHHLRSKFSTFASHPLFSTIVTLHTLTLLYAPSFFLSIVLSPVLNSTGIILLFLLKLGASQRLERESHYSEHRVLDHKDEHTENHLITSYSSFVLESTSFEQRFLDFVDGKQNDPESHQLMQVEFEHDSGLESSSHDDNSIESSHDAVEKGDIIRMETKMEDSKQAYTAVKCLNWNMKAPLEIIYEEYKGEEEDNDYNRNENEMVSSDHKDVLGFERYPSFSAGLESETDSSSDDEYFLINMNLETDESMFSNWDDRYDFEELIDISVDCFKKRSIEFCDHIEEDNLIEIDIFPMKK